MERPAFEVEFSDGTRIAIFASGRVEVENSPWHSPVSTIINRIPQLVSAAQANVDCEPR